MIAPKPVGQGAVSLGSATAERSVAYLWLAAATLACLLPFCRRPFDIDDVLFVRSAQHIVAHPFDPYGFSLVWYWSRMPMWDVTKNPPLAAYYAALIGRTAGWSELALHVGFMLPALAVILGTYRLALGFTKHPAVAALATLLAPGFLVSALSVMADVMLLAFWIWAVVLWTEGIEREKKARLLAAALLVACAELAKYMGISLVALLAFYAFAARRRPRLWAPYLLVPLALLAGYEYWGHLHYGQGLFLSAAQFARDQRRAWHLTKFASTLVGLSFAGGAFASGFTCAPLVWSRRQIGMAAVAVASLLAIVVAGLTKVATSYAHAHWIGMCAQMGLFVAGGISLLALPVADCWRRRNRLSWFLAVWVLGVFWFAVYTNYVINVRTMIALLPPAAILLVRRMETWGESRLPTPRLLFALALAGAIAFWVAWGDSEFGKAQQAAARSLRQEAQRGRVWFEGRWGFAYYMELEGARPFDRSYSELRAGDLLVVPSLQDAVIPSRKYTLERTLHFDVRSRVATQDRDLGAGFYSSRHGPLPFSLGPAAYEFYILKLES